MGHFPTLSPGDPPVPGPGAGDAYALVLPTSWPATGFSAMAS